MLGVEIQHGRRRWILIHRLGSYVVDGSFVV